MSFSNPRKAMSIEQFKAAVKKMVLVKITDEKRLEAEIPLRYYRTPIFQFDIKEQ